MIEMSVSEQVSTRKELEEFIVKCSLSMPAELVELFEAYTRWIWQYKCPGAIYRYYCDETTIYGANGTKSQGADGVVASTLAFQQAFPDRINEFVDIFAEGNEQDGYSFGQTTCMNGSNQGWSQFGSPTGKSLERDGEKVRSICECRVEKVEGRWRIIDEWVVGSSDAIRETCTIDCPEDEAASCSELDPINV